MLILAQKFKAVLAVVAHFSPRYQHGAPFDIFFSADLKHAEALKKDLSLNQDIAIYAYGEVAAYSAQRKLFNNSVNATKDFPFKNIKRYALADPDIAPYGKSAEALPDVLNALDHAQQIRANNVAHAFQYAASNMVDCAFVSYAQIKQFRHEQNSKGVILPLC